MIAGWSDYWDGMHHLAAQEIDEALQHHQVPDDSPFAHDHGVNPHGDVFDGPASAHDSTHGLGALHHGGSAFGGEANATASATPAEPSWLDTVANWGVHAATRFAFEELVDFAWQTDISTLPLAGHGADAGHAGSLHVGMPHGDGFTHQTTGFTCAVVSQKMILDQFQLVDHRTGEPLSEAQLVYDATSHGWLTDQGTSLDDLNRLLGHYGVASHAGHGWHDLIGELAAGHQVVLPVNADALWHDHSSFAEVFGFGGGSPNHAIVLKGMKVDDHGHVTVVINDPGRADGAGVEYPLDRFQSALDATHLEYVATDRAPPDWSPSHDTGSPSHADSGPARNDAALDFATAADYATSEDRHEFLRAV